MSLLTPDTGLLVWMAVIFAIVFFLLAKFGFPVITKAIDKRNDRIRESIRLAEEAEAKLANLAQEQEQLVEQARVEQGRIIKEANQTRDAMIAKAKQDASDEAAKILEHARIEIAAEKESALRDIRSQVALLSVQVAEKIVRKDLDSTSGQKALIDKYVDEAFSEKVN